MALTVTRTPAEAIPLVEKGEMTVLINIADLKAENGKTYRENNLARRHAIPLGALVEVQPEGVRLFVVRHDRDCDGTPLYVLGAIRSPEHHDPIHRGYPEECLAVIVEGNP